MSLCFSKPTECTMPRMNPDVNHELWVIMKWRCRFISCKKCSIWCALRTVGEAVHVVGIEDICCCCRSVPQSCSTLWPHGLQHTRLPCPLLSPGVCSNSCPLSRWCCLTLKRKNRQAINWEKIFAKHISDKGLTQNIQRTLKNSTIKKMYHLI